MRKKKICMGCAAVFMAAAVAAGCGSVRENKAAGAGDQTAEAAGGGATAAEDEKGKEVTIKVMVWDRGNAAPGTTSENNTLTDWIKRQVKEKYNINVEYAVVPRSSSNDKINIMMSGGSAPDIIFTYEQGIFNNYAVNGGLADLSEAYDKYGADIEKYAGEAQNMGQMNGKRFAVMKMKGAEAPRHTSYIRQDWLDALGMEMPKTKDALFTYLGAVAKKNPGGVNHVIPWAMSGRSDTEKGYLNFVGSYVNLKDEKEAYIYNEYYMAVAPGAIDGIKKLNELYNGGLISRDFATDTTEDIYKAQVSAGNVGFVSDDAIRVFDYFKILNPTIGHSTFSPVQCFELEDGSYRTPFEPRYGMFVMVPKTSEKKADACMKYLNWQADSQVAEDIAFTPDHVRDAQGVPVPLTEEELYAKGYPGTTDDLSIVTAAFDYTANKEAIIGQWLKTNKWEDKSWFENVYDVQCEGKFRFPTYSYLSDAEANYGQNVRSLMIEYVYKLISCPSADFDAVQKTEYENLVNAGLQKILDAREEYYDSLSK